MCFLDPDQLDAPKIELEIPKKQRKTRNGVKDMPTQDISIPSSLPSLDSYMHVNSLIEKLMSIFITNCDGTLNKCMGINFGVINIIFVQVKLMTNFCTLKLFHLL